MNEKQLLNNILTSDDYNKYVDNSESENPVLLDKYKKIFNNTSTYVPENVFLDIMQNKDYKRFGDFVQGTIMFIDVNGFTALTESLSRHGHAGAEEITNVLNAFYSRIIEKIHNYSGAVLKFGGDAIMALFRNHPDFCAEQHTKMAVSCAFKIMDNMKEYSSVNSRFGSFPLSISMALHRGEFYAIYSGSNSKNEFFLTGKSVNLTADIEGEAEKNEILADISTINSASDIITDYTLKQNFYHIKSGNPIPEQKLNMPSANINSIIELSNKINELLLFVDFNIYKKVRHWQGEYLEGEHRPVSIMFVNFYFSVDVQQVFKNNPDVIKKVYDDYLSSVFDIVSKQGGYVNKIDMYNKGDKIIILFGAPNAHADDDERVVNSGFEIINLKQRFTDITHNGITFSVKQKIGINSGFIFAGNIGSKTRKEFTVMGDAVNLAARIMSSAEPNELLISDVIYKKTEHVCVLGNTYSRKYKGKTGETVVHQLVDIKKEEAKGSNIFVGRIKESEKIKEIYNNGQCQRIVQITGPEGIGKSYFINRFLETNIQINQKIFVIRCMPAETAGVYNVFKQILSTIFNINIKGTRGLKQTLQDYIFEAKLEHLAFAMPLIGALFSDEFNNEPVFKLDDPEEKRDLFLNAVKSIFEYESLEKELILVFEDAELLSDNTVQAIDMVLSNKINNVFTFILSRKEHTLRTDYYNLVLNPFSETEITNFADEFPGVEGLDEKLLKNIYSRSKGIPYFIFEIIKSISKHGKNFELPESIYKGVLSRIDTLTEEQKTVFKYCSVLGVELDYEIVSNLVTNVSNLDKIINVLISEDFLTPAGDDKYIFKNALVQEVAYNSLADNTKTRLHVMAGDYIQNSDNADIDIEKTADHYYKGRDFNKAKTYLVKSADRSAKLSDYQNAVLKYNKVKNLFDTKVLEPDTEIQTSLNIKLGEIFLVTGNPKPALDNFNIAADFAKQNSDDKKHAECLLNIGIANQYIYEYENAVANFRNSYSISQKLNDKQSMGVCLQNIAVILSELGQIESAEREYNSALTLFENSDNEQGIADIYNNLGNIYRKMLEIDKAKDYYSKAYTIYKKVNNEMGMAYIHNNLGVIYNNIGDFEKSILEYEKSYEIEERIGNVFGAGITGVNIGNAYINLREYDNALQYFQKSLKVFAVRDNKNELANVYFNIANIYLYKEEYQKSASLLKKAYNFYQGTENNEGLFKTHYNIGIAYFKDNHIEIALKNFEESFKYLQELDNITISNNCSSVAGYFSKMNKPERAKDILKTGENILSKLKNDSIKIQIYLSISRVDEVLKQYDEAISYLEKTLEISKTNEDEKSENYTRMRLALLLKEKGEIKKAREILKQVEEFFDHATDNIGKLISYNKMGVINFLQNDFKQSIQYFNKCINEIKDLDYNSILSALNKKAGAVNVSSKDFDSAITNIKNALSYEKENQEVELSLTYEMLSRVLYEKGDMKQSLDMLYKSFDFAEYRKQEERVILTFKLAMLLVDNKKYHEAVDYLNQCSATGIENIAKKSLSQLSLIYDDISDINALEGIIVRLKKYEWDDNIKSILDKCYEKIQTVN